LPTAYFAGKLKFNPDKLHGYFRKKQHNLFLKLFTVAAKHCRKAEHSRGFAAGRFDDRRPDSLMVKQKNALLIS
jgi:hypothetical protein